MSNNNINNTLCVENEDLHSNIENNSDESLTTDEEEEISEESVNKLKKLKIKLQHVVPKQHKVESNAGSRSLTEKQKKAFERYGPLKRGPFSPAEDNIIKKNWKSFCKDHDWDVENVLPFLYMRHNGKIYIHSLRERQKFVQFLAKDLPWRSLYSVYSRFKILYSKLKCKKQKYTPKEDKIILKYMNNITLNDKDYKCAALAKMLHRHRHSIWYRYQILKHHFKQDTTNNVVSDVAWTIPLTEKFIKHLLTLTLCENINQLKDAVIPKVVWKKMEDMMVIKYSILKSFWQNQLHMQLFSSEPIILNNIKIKLIEYLYNHNVTNHKEIIWSKMMPYFDGMTIHFLRHLMYRMIRCSVRKANLKTFSDNVQYLYKNKVQDLMQEELNKYLPRLFYNNGKLSFIDDVCSESS